MSIANKISPTATANVAPSTSRTAGGGRQVASTGDRIDESGQSSFLGASDASVRHDQFRDQSGFFGDGRGREKREAYTPLVGRSALGFQANDGAEDDHRTVFSLGDVLRGVGIYETNMRIISGGLPPNGTALNLYY